jgi:pyruvate,water dikinase
VHIQPPAFFTIPEGEKPIAPEASVSGPKTLTGRTCTSGQVTGRIRVFNEFEMPEQIDFEIIVARHTDPGWTTLIGLSKGLIIDHGGILACCYCFARAWNTSHNRVENATNILNRPMVELMQQQARLNSYE